MYCDMALRALYLPAYTTIDLTAAKATAARLCGAATTGDLARMLDNDTFADIHITASTRRSAPGPTNSSAGTPHPCAPAPLRRWADKCLRWLLDGDRGVAAAPRGSALPLQRQPPAPAARASTRT